MVMWREMEAGSTQIITEKCFQHFVMSQFWGNSRQSRESTQTCCNQKLESFRAKYLGLRYAQEAELQTVTSSANSSCKSKSNLHVHTVWKGLEVKDWSLPLHLHTQTGITDRNITFEGPREILYIYLRVSFLLNVRQFY